MKPRALEIQMKLSDARKIHFLGIGGIGVSALARAFVKERKVVSGQDRVQSPLTDKLVLEGIDIFIGQSVSVIPRDADFVVFSNALLEREPKFLEKVEALGVSMLSYPEALGLYSKSKYTIAIAGTHGKTTTTSMIAHVLTKMKVSPTVIVGSLLKEGNTNFVSGKSKYLVVEADEYHRAFLELSPRILVITNIGIDHLDYYRDLRDIQSAFISLVAKVPASGYIVVDRSDGLVRDVLAGTRAKIVDSRDFYDKNMDLPFAGDHNRRNAASAIAVAHLLNLNQKRSAQSLDSFSGSWRRFDFKGKTPKGALVYDDYAHNPEKVKAALSGFREAHPSSRLVVVFQPHLYSRTKTLLQSFCKAFAGADTVIFVPIFAAREKKDASISSPILARTVRKYIGQAKLQKPEIFYASDLKKLGTKLRRTLSRDDVVITMGAGDIYELADVLKVKNK